MMDEQLQVVPDAELFGVEGGYNSDEDSDYLDRPAVSDSCTDDNEDEFPFVCDQCNKVFKSMAWFTKHICKQGCTDPQQ